MEDQYRDAVHDNLIEFTRLFGELKPDGDVREFDSVIAAFSGIPAGFCNRIFVVDTPDEGALERAVEWMETKESPYWVTVTEQARQAIPNRVASIPLTDLGAEPAMVLDSLDKLPGRSSPAAIDRVRENSDLDDFVSVHMQSFGLPEDIIRKVADESLIDEECAPMFVGRIDDEPVACGQTAITGTTAGVYNVGVVEEHRRKGIGEAMTWEVLRAGKEAGCHIGVLQSSEMGLSVYQRMGFETVFEYNYYTPTRFVDS